MSKTKRAAPAASFASPATSRPATSVPALHLAEVCAVMKRVVGLIGEFGLEPQHKRSPYESLMRAIAHQQLNGKAAETILGRFIALYPGSPFPSAEAVLATPPTKLRGCGFSEAKVKSLLDIAAKAVDGVVPDRRAIAKLSDEEIIARLTVIRGVGRWTVEMLLIFQLGRPDVLPVDDFGVRNGFRLAKKLPAMPTVKELAAYGERWKPHRTAAAWYLWRVADREAQEKAARKAAEKAATAANVLARKKSAPAKKSASKQAARPKRPKG